MGLASHRASAEDGRACSQRRGPASGRVAFCPLLVHCQADRRSARSRLREHACSRSLMVGFTPPPCAAGVIGATPSFPAALSQRRKRLTLVATILGSSMAFIDGSV